MNLLQKSLKFAEKIHEKEFRRDDITPYMTHVQKVVDISCARGGGEKEAIVSYLHDTLESGATEEQLFQEGFSEEIVEAVKLLSLKRELPYLENIKRLKTNNLAKHVKICDNLANLSDSPTDKQILKYSKSLLILLGYE